MSINTKDKKLKFIIYTPFYNEDIGGIIALYNLCDLLNKLGADARLYAHYPVRLSGGRLYRKIKHILILVSIFFESKFNITRLSRLLFGHTFIYSSFKTPVWFSKKIPSDTIVVYPEMIRENVLNATKIVRWLLYTPRLPYQDRGAKVLTICYQKAFNDYNANPDVHQMRILYTDSNRYFNMKLPNRSGRCYIIRKGANRKDLPSSFDGVIIDNMSHDQIAKVFNNCTYCISYDTHTYYSTYAAMCGCISVVVPESGVSKQQWKPDTNLHHGIAYGETLEELDYAAKTLPLLYEQQKETEQNNIKQVENFISICKTKFNNHEED